MASIRISALFIAIFLIICIGLEIEGHRCGCRHHEKPKPCQPSKQCDKSACAAKSLHHQRCLCYYANKTFAPFDFELGDLPDCNAEGGPVMEVGKGGHCHQYQRKCACDDKTDECVCVNKGINVSPKECNAEQCSAQSNITAWCNCFTPGGGPMAKFPIKAGGDCSKLSIPEASLPGKNVTCINVVKQCDCGPGPASILPNGCYCKYHF